MLTKYFDPIYKTLMERKERLERLLEDTNQILKDNDKELFLTYNEIDIFHDFKPHIYYQISSVTGDIARLLSGEYKKEEYHRGFAEVEKE